MIKKVLFMSIFFNFFAVYGSQDPKNVPHPPKFEYHQQESQEVDAEHYETRIAYKTMSLTEIEIVTAKYHGDYLQYLLCFLAWNKDENKKLQVQRSCGVLSFQPMKMKKISNRLISLISVEYDTAFCADPGYDAYVAREIERKVVRDALYQDVVKLEQ